MSLEEKILDVLRASDRPMKALDIARAIPGCEKRDVNRVIYNMREVERSNPRINPPLWQLYTGTVPTASTATPQPLQPQPQQQTTTTTTRATADSHGASSSGAMGQGAGENMPMNDNHHGSAASLTDAMSKISIGDSASATWDDKLLATIEKTEDGGFKVKPISREAIINRGTSDHSREADSAQGESLCPPVQESCSNKEIQMTSSLLKVNQINLSSGHEMMNSKGVDNYKERSENEAKRKEYSSQVFDHTLQATGKSYSEATQSTGSVPQPSSSSPTESKTKKKLTIAANFSGLGASSSITLKQQILEILKNESKPIDSFMIAQRLGHSTRVEAMGLLQELKDEGRVSELVRNEVSHWTIRE